MSAHSIPHYTVEEYLERDEASEIPLEYYDGQIFPIAEATYAHAALLPNVCVALKSALAGKGCTVLATPLRVKAGRSYVHPDIAVVCGKPVFVDKFETILNPVLIVEILSESTEADDRGAKFHHYRSLETMREYVLVLQTEPCIDVFTRDPGGFWTFRVFSGLEAVCYLSSPNCSLPLAGVYENVPLTEFEAGQAANE